MLLLEELVEALNIEVQPFAVCRIGTGAKMSVPAFDEATVHYTVAGQGALTVKGSAPIDLSPGTMVILPKKAVHEVAAVGTGAPMPVDLRRCGLQHQGIEVLEAGWQGTGVVLTCGHVSATYQSGSWAAVAMRAAAVSVVTVAAPATLALRKLRRSTPSCFASRTCSLYT